MGFWVRLFFIIFVFSFSFGAANAGDSLTQANESGLTEAPRIEKLRTREAVIAQYCYVQTGGGISGSCGSNGGEDKLDVVYAPRAFGERVLSHIESAYGKGYYANMNKTDLFHGHFLAKGPQVNYPSAQAWFQDVEVLLYHSAEYLHDWWTDIPKDSTQYVEHEKERSFVGWAKGDEEGVVSAISLILPTVFLKSYAGAGTVYAEELNESIHVSEHNWTNFAGTDDWYVNTCEAGESDCQPCRIFNMMYLMEKADGRFLTPDGVRIEVFFHCKFN